MRRSFFTLSVLLLSVTVNGTDNKFEDDLSFNNLGCSVLELVDSTNKFYYNQGDSSLNSQFFYEYDSVWNQSTVLSSNWNEQTETWIPSSIIEYMYDSTGQEVKKTVRTWNTMLVDWRNLVKDEYTYDDHSRLIDHSSFRWSSKDNDWYGNRKEVAGFDEFGNQNLDCQYIWNRSTAQFDGDSRYEYIVDSVGTLHVREDLIWDPDLSVWDPGTKRNYYYDLNGYDSLEILVSWDKGLGDWVNTEKLEHSCDQYGKLILSNIYEWRTNISQWELEYKREFTYDNNDSLELVMLSSCYNDGSTFGKEKTEISYDSIGRKTMETKFEFSIGMNDWAVLEKEVHAYDSAGNTVLEAFYAGVDLNWGTVAGVSRKDHSYDSDGNTIGTIEYDWDETGEKWVESSFSDFTLDGLGKRWIWAEYNWEDSWILDYKIYHYHKYDLSSVDADIPKGLIFPTTTTMEYSLNSLDGIDGSWTACTDSTTMAEFSKDGNKVWIRQMCLPQICRLIASVPAQEPAPDFIIDFQTETTGEMISSDYEYCFVSESGQFVPGQNEKINIPPDTTIYIRKMATKHSFESITQELASPGRPDTPAYSIDMVNEQSNEPVAPGDEYSINSNMSESISGQSEKIILEPDQVLYFRVRASDSSYSSPIQELIVPGRQPTPSYSINFPEEKTGEIIPDSVEYSLNSDLSLSNSGENLFLELLPGQDLYFRILPGQDHFKSDIQALAVPNRPEMPHTPVINDLENTFDWSFSPLFSAIDDYSFSIDSGAIWATCLIKPMNIGNLELPAGKVQVRVKATDSRFKSDALLSDSDFTLITGINDHSDLDYKIFPNPVSKTLFLNRSMGEGIVSIFNSEGKLVTSMKVTKGTLSIDVSDLNNGTYVLHLLENKKIFSVIFLKEDNLN